VKLSQGIPTIAIVVGISGGALVSTLSDSASPVLLSCLAVPLLVLIYWKPHIGLCLVLFSLMMHGLYTVILPDVAIIGYVEPLLMVYVFCVVAIRNFRSQQIMGWVLRSRLGIAVLVFVAFGATRAAFSEDQLAAWLGFATLCLYSTGFFIVCGTVTDKRRFTGVVSFILAAIAITALLAVSAFIFDWRLIAGPGVEAGYGYIRMAGTFGSPIICANFMACGILIALSLLLAAKQLWKRVFFLALIALFASVDLLAFTRSVWIGTLIGIFAVAWSEGPRLHLRFLFTFGFLLPIIVVVPFLLLPSDAVLSIAASRLEQNTVNDTVRMDRWEEGWQRASATSTSLVFGRGLGGVGPPAGIAFRIRHPGIRDQWTLAKYYLETESWIFHLLNEVGLVGLGLYLLVVFETLFRSDLKSSNISPDLLPWKRGLRAALYSLLVSNIFLPSLGAWSVSALSWTLIGLIYCSSDKVLQRTSSGRKLIVWKPNQLLLPTRRGFAKV